MPGETALSDKYMLTEGRVFLTGTQALTRVLLDQRRTDLAAGANTAGFISGYRGSPLGSLDTALWGARETLDRESIVFQPGVNEELAATAVYGTQQVGFFPGARHDGVFAAWYGKGPGVDRAGDALKHGNLAGTAALGGVLVLAGDDHAAKSSTTAHQSEQALVASLIPVLYPASVAEFLEFGAFGFALSRFSGLWAGFKCVNDTADGTATASLAYRSREWVLPAVEMPPEGLNILLGESQLSMERRTTDFRLPAAQAFIRANRLDRILRDGDRRTLGIVTAGKAALDTVEALNQLGLDAARCRALGIRVLKLAMTWPVEHETLRDFSHGHRQLLVVEEKRAFVEPQVASILYHVDAANRPILTGKTDATGRPLLPQSGEFGPTQIAAAIFAQLDALGIADTPLRRRYEQLTATLAARESALTAHARMPFFCSGCPHNTSTVVPAGSVALSGIGCHVMAAMMPHRKHLWPVQMGGEGANWIGVAPFSDTRHIFQNLGDGTYHHSGSLAVRAAVAAGITITYKLLFNDAVAMTGGQPVEGQLTPWQIAAELLQEGVHRVVVVADDPGKYPPTIRFPDGVAVRPRGELDAVQRELADIDGVTVLIYDQLCAAEKRRRGKRAARAALPKRMFINEMVCEGCGDCSVKSNCVSVQPLETEFGRKRQIDQSSCNTDYSCAEGFCPSFVSVRGGDLRGRALAQMPAMPELPPPAPAAVGPSAILIAGIGGTGVVTIGAVLGMAAYLDGKAASIIDVTGLSQKNGAVFSHLRIAPDEDMIAAARIPAAGAELVLACDMIAAGGSEAMALVEPGRTRGVVNQHLTPTAAFTIDTAIDFAGAETARRLRGVLAADSVFTDATLVATRLMGDAIGANMFVVGAALQRGLLPVSLAAVERAIALNGVAVEFNRRALSLGRLAVADPAALEAVLRDDDPVRPDVADDAAASRQAIDRRAAFLARYQDEAYARRFGERVAAIAAAERRVAPGRTGLGDIAARNLFKLMAYKDEYEVARLYTSDEFRARLESQFAGDYRLSVHLAPPLFARRDRVTGLPRKREFGPWIFGAFRLLARARRLRGTAFDVFGYTAERRLERRLARDYEAVLERIEAELRPDNYDAALALAAYPETIRGYGHVKARSLPGALAERDRGLEELSAPRKVLEHAA